MGGSPLVIPLADFLPGSYLREYPICWQIMIKHIRRDQLIPGMYIHDLNCSWIDHPFLLNTFKVEDEKAIAKIAELGIVELFIDTGKGFDVDGAKTQEEHQAEIHQEFHEKIADYQRHPGNLAPAVPLKAEIVNARRVHHDAHLVAHQILSDARLGKQVEVQKVEPVVESITESVFRNRNALISLSRLKNKDDYTFQHSVSVCVLLISFCQAMGYERSVMREVGVGGLLHDIGKMKIPDHILNKPIELTAPEFSQMQSHAALGREMLKGTPGITETAIVVAAQHHERYDGTGYPDRLKGNQIAVFGQMASIVDVYDALTSNRVYHSGMDPVAALKKLFEWSKSHFNEELVHHFIRTIGIFPVGSLVMLKSGRIGVVIDPDNNNLLHPVVRVIYDTNTSRKLSPQDIDFSKTGESQATDNIIGHELPQRWGIDPYAYL